MILTHAVADWLLSSGVISESDIDGPADAAEGQIVLTREASEEFENGVRVGMLLQLLWSDGAAHPDEALDTLKELHTPVAKLHNWNALLPRLKARGAEVDADMKVLIVAGDADIVVDVLEQLRVADRRVKAVLRRKDEISQPATAGAASSVAHFLAFCCQQQLQMSWARSLEMARSPGHKQLAALQRGGEAGNFAAVVRWCKLAFAHCKHLCTLCAVDPAEADLALGAAGGGLASRNADVVLWTARLLQRMAADLTERGAPGALWRWFSRPAGGAALLLDAFRAHPELHAAGALLPIVPHYCGEQLHLFFSTVLPRHLPAPGAYFTFTAELLPLLASSPSTKAYLADNGTLKAILQKGLQLVRTHSAPPAARGVAIEVRPASGPRSPARPPPARPPSLRPPAAPLTVPPPLAPSRCSPSSGRPSRASSSRSR